MGNSFSLARRNSLSPGRRGVLLSPCACAQALRLFSSAATFPIHAPWPTRRQSSRRGRARWARSVTDWKPRSLRSLRGFRALGTRDSKGAFSTARCGKRPEATPGNSLDNTGNFLSKPGSFLSRAGICLREETSSARRRKLHAQALSLGRDGWKQVALILWRREPGLAWLTTHYLLHGHDLLLLRWSFPLSHYQSVQLGAYHVSTPYESRALHEDRFAPAWLVHPGISQGRH